MGDENELGEPDLSLPDGEAPVIGPATRTGLRLSDGETAPIGISDDSYAGLRNEAQRGQSVRSRARRYFETPGVAVGSFLLRPYGDVQTEYDSNVLAQSDGQDDISARLAAGAALESDWARHRLTASTSVTHREYIDLTSESGTEYDARIDGTLDIVEDTFLSLSGLHEHRLVDRGAVGETLDTQEPVRLDRSAVALAAQTTRGRIFAKLTGQYDHFDYQDAVTPSGALSNQQFRDTDAYELKGELGWRVGADSYAFGLVSFAPRRARLDSTPLRDVDQTELLAGWRSEISPLIVGHIAAGYLQGDFKDPALETRRAFSFSVDVDYFVTPLTTVSLTADRSIRGISSISSAGALVSSFGARLDHEVLRTLIVSATADVESADYIDSPAKATRAGGSVSADWRVARNVAINGFVRLSGRSADNFDSDRDFSRFAAGVGARLSF